ncbi:hypothetical protein MKK69_08995 [Methylobacterium sp. J-026]|nr:hypothetical protein [Methylobacterium sp. J-026]
MAQSLFSTRECEVLARRRFRSQAKARRAWFSDFERLYDPLRRHSALGYRSPAVAEQETDHEPSSEALLSQAPNRPPRPKRP